MNNQEAFNKIWERAKTKKKSRAIIRGVEVCAYRSYDNSCACFVGVLIPDSIYKELMERKSALVVMDVFKEVAEHLSGVSRLLLTRFQRIHDTDEPEFWNTDLRHVAREFKLEVPK